MFPPADDSKQSRYRRLVRKIARKIGTCPFQELGLAVLVVKSTQDVDLTTPFHSKPGNGFGEFDVPTLFALAQRRYNGRLFEGWDVGLP
jgi:hypothetical protein